MMSLVQERLLNAAFLDGPEGTAMLAALSRKHIAMTGRLGSGPALGPKRKGNSRRKHSEM